MANDILSQCVLMRGVPPDQGGEYVKRLVAKHLGQVQCVVNVECVSVEIEQNTWIIQLDTEEAVQRLLKDVKQEVIIVEKDQRRSIHYEQAQLCHVPHNWKNAREVSQDNKAQLSTPLQGYNVPYNYIPYNAYSHSAQPMHDRQITRPGVPPAMGIGMQMYGPTPADAVATPSVSQLGGHQYLDKTHGIYAQNPGNCYPGLPQISSQETPPYVTPAYYRPFKENIYTPTGQEEMYPSNKEEKQCHSGTSSHVSTYEAVHQYPAQHNSQTSHHNQQTDVITIRQERTGHGHDSSRTSPVQKRLNPRNLYSETPQKQKYPENRKEKSPPSQNLIKQETAQPFGSSETTAGNTCRGAPVTSSHPIPIKQHFETPYPSPKHPWHQYVQTPQSSNWPNQHTQYPHTPIAGHPQLSNYQQLPPSLRPAHLTYPLTASETHHEYEHQYGSPFERNINQERHQGFFPTRPFPNQPTYMPKTPGVPYVQYPQHFYQQHVGFGHNQPPFQQPNFGFMQPPVQFPPNAPMNYPGQPQMIMHPDGGSGPDRFTTKVKQIGTEISYSDDEGQNIDPSSTNNHDEKINAAEKDNVSEPSEQTQTFVKVIGISNVESKQNLELYFEIKRKSGGGEVKEFRYDDQDKDVMYIQFVSAADAKAVIGRQHILCDCELRVSPYTPPPFDEKKLLIEGLNTLTTRECLFDFLEAKADCDPKDWCIHSENKSTVLVTMNREIEFEKVKQACARHKLEKARLYVSRVHVTNCVLITNLTPSISDDTVLNYFENKRRSKGGPIEQVKRNEDKTAAFVYFENFEDAQCATDTTHKLSDVKLKVELYLPCLGRPKWFLRQKIQKTPMTFKIKVDDSEKMEFLKNSKAKQQLEAILHDYGTRMKVHEVNVIAFEKDMSDTTTDGTRDVGNWTADVTTAFNNFMEIICVYKCAVEENWTAVTQAVKEINIENPQSVTVALNHDKRTITVVGFRPDSEQVYRKVENIITEIRKETEMKKSMTKDITTMNYAECRLLNLTSFTQKNKVSRPNLVVTIDEENKQITFEGVQSEINEAKIQMFQAKTEFWRKKYKVTDDLCSRLYKSEETKQYVTEILQEQGVRCVWEMNGDTILVYGENKAIGETSMNFISRAIVIHNVSVQKESDAYLETNECKKNMMEIQQKHEGQVLIALDTDGCCIRVCCLEYLLEDIVCEVNEDISRNASLQTKLTCSRNKIVFVEKVLNKNVNDIEGKLQIYRVRISLKRTGFIIHGTEKGMNEAKKEIEILLKSVKQVDRTFSKPGFAKFIGTGSGKDELRTIEKDISCIIAVEKENVDEPNKSKHAQRYIATSVFATCKLDGGVDVEAKLCDITELAVSVIVSNTDENLSMNYGLGKIIAMKGGSEVKESCREYVEKHGKLRHYKVLESPAGKLKAQHIVHVTIPGWQRGRDAADKLEMAVIKCLEKATELGASSIAIPAIGCGASKFPVDKATDAIVAALEKFVRKHTDCSLTNVTLCDMKHGVVEEFTRALIDKFGNKRVRVMADRHSGQTRTEKHPDRGSGRNFDRQRRSSANTDQVALGKVKVAILKGTVARQKVDAIVNVIDKTLDLKRGTISASLLDAGGVKLQEELKTKYPDGLEYGQVAITSGQKLTCRSVIHCRLMPWDGSNADTSVESLQTFMKICLESVHRQNLESIVFHGIGTGKLGYPKDVVAKQVFASIATFCNDNPQSSIKEVRIVIYQDDVQTIKAFEEERSHWATGKRVGPRELRSFNHDYEDEVSGKECKIGHLNLTIKQGDILDEDTECIVNSIPYSMDLRKGTVSRNIVKKCGDDIVEELKKKRDWMKKYGLVVTAAPNLPSSRIIHIAVQERPDGWRKVVEKALKRTEEKQLHSVAFPALGTGNRNSPEEMADCIITAIVEFSKTKPEYVNDVRLVIFQPEMVQVFESRAREHSLESLGHINRGMDYSGDSDSKVTFTILALGHDVIERAAKRIEKCYQRKEFREDVIKRFKRYHHKRIDEVSSQENVSVNIDRDKGEIKVCGLAENVGRAADRIHTILRDALKFEKNETSADFLSYKVQWFFTDNDGSAKKLVPYDKAINYKIENAFSAKELAVTFSDSKKRQFKIDFNLMKEYAVDRSLDAVAVVRKDVKKDDSFSPPVTWAQMTSNLMLVPLAKTDQEYIDTEKTFMAVQAGINVVKIERVQNKTLWQQYQAKKQLMDQQNPPNTKNESLLWHGSSDIRIENIKVNGFDRGYSNMGCSIGVGVYFSPLASVSHGYARADNTGIRKMFHCRVLTGEYCLGQHAIRVPPLKPSGGQHARYDSVVNNVNTPTEFVIFNDAQAYPEYLIHFK